MKVALKVDRNQAEVLANNSMITDDFHKGTDQQKGLVY
jgi:hypothetical protein